MLKLKRLLCGLCLFALSFQAGSLRVEAQILTHDPLTFQQLVLKTGLDLAKMFLMTKLLEALPDPLAQAAGLPLSAIKFNEQTGKIDYSGVKEGFEKFKQLSVEQILVIGANYLRNSGLMREIPFAQDEITKEVLDTVLKGDKTTKEIEQTVYKIMGHAGTGGSGPDYDRSARELIKAILYRQKFMAKNQQEREKDQQKIMDQERKTTNAFDHIKISGEKESLIISNLEDLNSRQSDLTTMMINERAERARAEIDARERLEWAKQDLVEFFVALERGRPQPTKPNRK